VKDVVNKGKGDVVDYVNAVPLHGDIANVPALFDAARIERD